MTDGYDERTAYGFIDGHDDPSMGWARYAQAFKHFNLNSGLFYLRANVRTAALMQRLADRLERQKYWRVHVFFVSFNAPRSCRNSLLHLSTTIYTVMILSRAVTYTYLIAFAFHIATCLYIV